ncbi:hypothetical protein CLU96_4531 [Chryseobacterium sp. 52]|uniref:hypothetical protein n=1 Tax=Chryseobacterium sp. 52 TaxID=2035213 RepID=UPI000C18D546|nr:hypothetical protein CLU96_4531 [Chryseobacterium sp. 52]
MKHYTQQELEHGGNSEEEQKRLRMIFEDLKQKALTKKLLLEREKEFLCTSINHSLIKSDGNPEDFDFCEDYIFRGLYLTYYGQSENGPFYKPHGTTIIQVSESEKKKDLQKLDKIAKEWEKTINITNHKEQLLQDLSSEIRQEDLKGLNKKFPKLIRKLKRKNEAFIYEKRKLLLHSKFIYLMVKSISQNFDSIDFEIPFSKSTIEITPYSFVHIINRHYAEKIKNKPDKTYHYKNFYPKELHLDLKNILLEIDKHNIIDLNTQDNFIFIYDNVTYHIWIQKRNKQIQGKKGNIEFFRLQSFYPIYDKTELEIKLNYSEYKINDRISLFINGTKS